MNKDLQEYNQLHYGEESSVPTDSELRKVYSLTETAEIQPDVDAGWNCILEKISEKKGVYRQLWRVAAAILLISGLTLTYFTIFSGPEVVRFVATAGQETYDLPDGSVVYLKQGASLSFEEQFEPREVKFKGTGFFEIEKSSYPFTLVLKNGEVGVLGTSFQVSESKDETMVFVLEGKVRISNKSQTLLLSDGQEASFTGKRSDIHSSNLGDINQVAWVTNELIFDNTSLEDVISTLNNHFEVTISIKDKLLGNCTVTGTFDGKSLSDVLDSISKILHLKITKRGEEYILSGSGC